MRPGCVTSRGIFMLASVNYDNLYNGIWNGAKFALSSPWVWLIIVIAPVGWYFERRIVEAKQARKHARKKNLTKRRNRS